MSTATTTTTTTTAMSTATATTTTTTPTTKPTTVTLLPTITVSSSSSTTGFQIPTVDSNVTVAACSEGSRPAILNSVSGEITSPGLLAKQTYPNNARCDWKIAVPPGMVRHFGLVAA
jgi:hypothetical protein